MVGKEDGTRMLVQASTIRGTVAEEIDQKHGSHTMMDSKTWFFLIGVASVAISTLGNGTVLVSRTDQFEITDGNISAKIDDELQRDPAVDVSSVEVSTTDGIVELSGEVDNLLAKERAARIAEAVKGVRAVVNRLQVKPPSRPADAELAKDIEQALLADSSTDSYAVDARVDNGVVTLTGSVDSHQQRRHTAIVVKQVRGVIDVDNRIRVDFTTTRPDSDIRRDIQHSLKWNRYVDDNLINVQVEDGQVTLSGTVGSAAERRNALHIAWVAGVSQVDGSALIVAHWARDAALRGDKYVSKSDEELREAVQGALLLDPRVDSPNIQVEAAGGTVVLRGSVASLRAKRAAEQDARRTVGVTRVVNRLEIQCSSSTEDKIAAEIGKAFTRDPYLDRFDLTITVTDGTAHLAGTVDSPYEKHRADDVAANIQGVVDVKNEISVNYDAAYVFDPYVDDDLAAGPGSERLPKQTSDKTDEQIRDEIRSELWWSPFVDSDEVTVAVNGQVARLSGTVDSWSEREAAVKNAYDGGAISVDNDLRVND
jgi:osmotically-inducible protein OsmY